MAATSPPPSISDVSSDDVRSLDSSRSSSPDLVTSPPTHHLPVNVQETMGVSHPPTQDVPATPLPHITDTPQNAVHGSIMLPIGQLLLDTFLMHLLDKRGLVQTFIWLLNDLGRSLVGIDTLLIYRQNVDVECHGRIMRFIVRDWNSALFQVKLLGWNTTWGWRAPLHHLYAYVIVPLQRCQPVVGAECYAYFGMSMQLANHTFKMAQKVADYMDRKIPAQLPNDPVTSAIHETFLSSPDSMLFSRDMGTGSATPIADMTTNMYARLGQPPSDFNPGADLPPYLGRIPDVYQLQRTLHTATIQAIPLSPPVRISDSSPSSPRNITHLAYLNAGSSSTLQQIVASFVQRRVQPLRTSPPLRTSLAALFALSVCSQLALRLREREVPMKIGKKWPLYNLSTRRKDNI
ncbi:hypothetical protein PENSPDRAFT_670074 [Peniophora sp. CONT]|nr:hypothetical protein PENSPDRAFT_670074 [Peniophora sp. CONT]